MPGIFLWACVYFVACLVFAISVPLLQIRKKEHKKAKKEECSGYCDIFHLPQKHEKHMIFWETKDKNTPTETDAPHT